MKDLLSMAMTATQNNVVKTTRKENINEALMRRLYHKGQKFTRLEMINALTFDRMLQEMSEEELTKGLESYEKEGKLSDSEKEFQKKFNKTNMTVKNGIDTSVSHSQNNSSFHYNEKYNDYKLEEVAGKWQITDAKSTQEK